LRFRALLDLEETAMRTRFYLLTAAALLAASPVFAMPAALAPKSAKSAECNARWNTLSVEDKDRVNYANFETTCQSDLARYPDPMATVATDARPLSAITGLCRDHTYAQSRDRRDACRNHGGVDLWFAAGT
jgi:hypothetical protein